MGSLNRRTCTEYFVGSTAGLMSQRNLPNLQVRWYQQATGCKLQAGSFQLASSDASSRAGAPGRGRMVGIVPLSFGLLHSTVASSFTL